MGSGVLFFQSSQASFRFRSSPQAHCVSWSEIAACSGQIWQRQADVVEFMRTEIRLLYNNCIIVLA